MYTNAASIISSPSIRYTSQCIVLWGQIAPMTTILVSSGCLCLISFWFGLMDFADFLYCGHSLTLFVASYMICNHNALIRVVGGSPCKREQRGSLWPICRGLSQQTPFAVHENSSFVSPHSAATFWNSCGELVAMSANCSPPRRAISSRHIQPQLNTFEAALVIRKIRNYPIGQVILGQPLSNIKCRAQRVLVLVLESPFLWHLSTITTKPSLSLLTQRLC